MKAKLVIDNVAKMIMVKDLQGKILYSEPFPEGGELTLESTIKISEAMEKYSLGKIA